ncbi:MAG: DUF1572 domain-containing protein [bacterium]|nr:DUF1572 domain-containing protein [bacterium]
MNWTNALREEFELRVFHESYLRIEKCLNTISDEQLWTAPNENMTSIGCLIKHLLGNAQQWLYAGVLGQEFIRDRNAEFVPQPKVKKEGLLKTMNEVRSKIENALDKLTEANLSQKMTIQGFETTGLSATIHVIEHFSYHTGQISLLTKSFQNVDLGYYSNHDLDV